MDAANKLFLKIALLLPLVLPISALAQTLTVSTSTVTIPPAGGGQCVPVQVTSSSASAITFSISTPAPWYTATASNGNTTPSTLQICISQALGNQPPSTLTLTDTTNAANKRDITVNYVVGGGGGGGLITASPPSLAMAVAAGSSSTQNVILSTTSPTPVFVTATVTGNPIFITQALVTPTTVSSTATASLSVTASSVGLLTGQQYLNTVVLSGGGGQTSTVQVTMTVGTGGTGTSSYFVSPNSFAFAYPSGTLSGSAFVSSALTVYNATANSLNSWLLVNGGTQVQSLVTSGVFLTVNTTAAQSLSAGLYSGTVTVSNPSNPSDNTVITATLTIGGGTGSLSNLVLNPTTVTFNAAAGSGLQQAQINMSAANGVATTYSTPTVSSTGWLSLASVGIGSLPSAIVINANAFGLAAGTYNGSVNVTFNGGVFGTQTIPVTLIVGGGGGGGGTTGGVAPTTLTFSSQTNAINGSVPQQYLTVGGTGPLSVAATVTTPQSWLSATATTNTAPGFVVVGVNAGGLNAGSYNGTLTVTSNFATTNIPVTLLVTSSPVVQVSPVATINSNFPAGSSSPSTTQISITSSDNSSIPLSASSSAAWVTLGGFTSGTTPATVQVTVNPAGLPAGVNTASITITATGAANSPITVPVVALVAGGTTGGTLTLSTSQLTFSGALNGSPPAAQTLTVSAAAATSFTASANVQSGSTGWLTISPSGNLLTNQTLTVSVNQTGLLAGTYSGTIALTANSVTQNVPVTLIVGGAGTGGTVTATPSSLNFTYDVGGSTPGVQGLTIANASGATPVSFVVTTTGSFVNAGVASGTQLTTPITLTVSANIAGLAGGTYNGSIVATPIGGVAVTVPVTLTVTSNTVTAATASGTTLSFDHRLGDAQPATKPITVTGNGSFTATAQSTGGWLAAAPGSGTVTTGSPTTVTATVNPTNLAPGTHNGTITVAGTGGTTGSTTINVTLVVTAPLPTITRVTNAASYIAGAISPGEIITIFGVAIGPTASAGLELDASGRVATIIGGVQVLVNGFLSPMVFANSTQVSAVVPYEVKGSLSAVVQIRYLGQASNAMTVTVAATAPGLFTANSTGTGPVAFSYSNPTFATPTRGDVIAIYATGEGETTPNGITGKVTTVSATPPITPTPLLPVVVMIDGIVAEMLFVGEAPGFVSGALQINVRIPNGAQSGARPIRVTMGGQSSQPDVTLQIR